ncbi:MAG: HupE/UreJ family protein, partial [Alphaproteobacteria bacterium]|nr:HupE/UreJ family protein [Alphaproteobacteria bacterium]
AAVEALIGFTVAWAAGDALARARGLSPWLGLVGAIGILLLPMLAWLLGLPSLSWMVLAGVALFAAVMSLARQFDAPIVAPAIATVFGLAHGAGFAGPLLALHIPADGLLLTLLAFNLGVEAGQLTALALFGAAIWILRKTLKQVPALAFDVTAASLFALGTFWFVSRALA